MYDCIYIYLDIIRKSFIVKNMKIYVKYILKRYKVCASVKFIKLTCTTDLNLWIF